jgi:hypothetical protein
MPLVGHERVLAAAAGATALPPARPVRGAGEPASDRRLGAGRPRRRLWTLQITPSKDQRRAERLIQTTYMRNRRNPC